MGSSTIQTKFQRTQTHQSSSPDAGVVTGRGSAERQTQMAAPGAGGLPCSISPVRQAFSLYRFVSEACDVLLSSAR